MSENEKANAAAADAAALKRKILRTMVVTPLALGAMFFAPAGTLRYWQAWVYMAVLLVPMICLLGYFLARDPAVLERRMRAREKEREQKMIILLGYPAFLGAYLLPGFDRRFGWSQVPVPLVIAADVIVLAAYLFFFRVLAENRFAGRTVEVEQGQKLIDSGPYARVRHPMYSAVLPMYVLTPLALGSYWAVLPALLLPVMLVARIFNEEKVLRRDLTGYADYMNRVKYRLIPGVW